jgi:iduronate 2-sulfatase
MGYTVRTDSHRYTEWISTGSKEVVARELYDHAADCGETKNLSGEKDAEELVKKHSELLRGMIDPPAAKAGAKAGGAPGGNKKKAE